MQFSLERLINDLWSSIGKNWNFAVNCDVKRFFIQQTKPQSKLTGKSLKLPVQKENHLKPKSELVQEQLYQLHKGIYKKKNIRYQIAVKNESILSLPFFFSQKSSSWNIHSWCCTRLWFLLFHRGGFSFCAKLWVAFTFSSSSF